MEGGSYNGSGEFHILATEGSAEAVNLQIYCITPMGASHNKGGVENLGM